jgi:hypothetical protein
MLGGVCHKVLSITHVSETSVGINGVVVTWVVAKRIISTRRGFDSLLMHFLKPLLGEVSCPSVHRIT